METTHIRAGGDRTYWDKVAAIARLQKRSLGAVVKDCVDQVLAEQLLEVERVTPFFLPQNVAEQQRSNDAEAEHA